MSGGARSLRGARGRRIALAAVLAVIGLFCATAVSGCTSGARFDGRRYEIAGGGTVGIYYSYGNQLAGALQRELGMDVEVAETHGSVDNLRRVGSGRALLGFAQGDAAADAVAGSGPFSSPLPVRALARVYDEYVHIVVPADSEVRRIGDFAGRRVSLGAPSSGVTGIAKRLLAAADVPLDEVDDPELGLDASIAAMEAGEIDGFFWVGGVPTPGIEQLAEAMPIRLLSVDAGTVEEVNTAHAGVYRLADFPLGVYGVESPTTAMTVPNYLLTSADAPDDLIADVVRVLFESRTAMARKVAAAEVLDRRQAIFTGPVELHPGAAEYYVEAHR